MNMIIDCSDYIVLITGCAGFIGGALALRLIETTSAKIVGIDNMNDYYDVRLKEYRLERIRKKDKEDRFTFIKADISDKDRITNIFDKYKPTVVVHLAAQAGVRYSIENPDVYIQSNIIGFYNMLESCRRRIKENDGYSLRHFVYASSSSVYGNNKKIPHSERDQTDQPVSLYAATKKADEVMAYAYSKLYGIPMTGMRFFTVYGPAGRPDMAYYKFTKMLIAGEIIELYNNGKNKRDFTYIDDVIDAVEKIMVSVPEHNQDGVAHRIYNIGNNNPVSTMALVQVLEKTLKKTRIISSETNIKDNIKLVPSMVGDVELTYADIADMEKKFKIKPKISLDEGINLFALWYASYIMQC